MKMDLIRKFSQNYFSFFKRFLPNQTAPSSVGLDAGSSECKMVELVPKAKGFALSAWDLEPVQGADLAAPIQTVWQRAGITVKSPYSAIAGKGSLVRFLDLPRMNTDELKRSFSAEAEKHFPFPADQIYTDCFPLDSSAKGKKIPVVAAAVKKNIVDERINILNKAGLQPNFIGVNSIALMNVVGTFGFSAEDEPGAGIALLDLGESVSGLSVFIDRRPVFTRDIFIGGRDFTHKIQNLAGVTLEDAERLKREPGDQAESVQRACEMVIANIAQEVKLSFEYFSSEKNEHVKRIYLVGGGALIPDLCQKVSEALEMPAEAWDPLHGVELSKDINQEELKKESPKLGVALGLALYDYV